MASRTEGWRHFIFTTPDRSADEFAGVAVKLALQYPAAGTIHLIMDNLNIHRRKSLTGLLGEPLGADVWDCFTVHYTPIRNQNRIALASVPRPAANP
ncbi:MAG TPA: transposase [Bryobacteraceae bacterium]|nr:transposase [Bryobacteraceae bacterium]